MNDVLRNTGWFFVRVYCQKKTKKCFFMSMGLCIFICEDHISNRRDATFCAHLLIVTLSTCFGRHSPIIESSETVCAANGTVMLLYVMIGSTVLYMGL
jgi:hypothetical protein